MCRARKPLSTCITLAAVLYGVAAGAQTPTGGVNGVVRTASGMAVASARVTVANSTSGSIRSGTTDANGHYAIAGLPPGAYAVTATVVGYRRTSRRDVRVDNETTVDLVLEPVPLNAITVTATLREQELKDVPFSIAAPTASELRSRGAETIEDIATTQAGFSVQNLGPGQSQVAMRGTSSGQTARDQPGVKEEVGVYLDGVPISLSLFTPDMDLFDVSRVEVLRGPQGTLFGAGLARWARCATSATSPSWASTASSARSVAPRSTADPPAATSSSARTFPSATTRPAASRRTTTAWAGTWMPSSPT